MITFKFKSHSISIKEDDWRKLKERFDVRNAEKDKNNDYLISSKCPLCIRYKDNLIPCLGCPLEINQKCYCGGMNIINSFFRKRFFFFIKDGIWWNPINDRQARRQLKAILRRMGEIEANQKSEKEV